MIPNVDFQNYMCFGLLKLIICVKIKIILAVKVRIDVYSIKNVKISQALGRNCVTFLCAHLMAILMALLCYTWIQSVELQAQVSCSNIDRNIHSLIRKPLHIVDFTFDV